MRNTVAVHVGHLVEVRSEAGFRTPKDVDNLFETYMQVSSGFAAGARHATIVDHRHCPIMSPEAAAHFSGWLASVNERTSRSATLTCVDSASASLQYGRVVREAAFPNRRIVADESSAIGWLGAVLTPEERSRLIVFLRERTTP